MPRHPTPLPAALGRVFRTDEARARGATEGRLRAGDLDRPFRGVRVIRAAVHSDPGEQNDPAVPYPADDIARAAIHTRVEAHALVLPERGFYVGEAAFALLGLPLLQSWLAPGRDLPVAVFAPHRAVRRPGIRCVQVRAGLAHTTSVDGFPVASAATAWAMLGGELSERDLVKLGDAIRRIPRDERGRRRPDRQVATAEQLQAAIDAGPRRGIAKLRSALARTTDHSMSLLETDWRENLREAGLPEPALDVEIRGERGILLGIADGAFAEFRVAVEVHGDHHRVSRAQWDRDIQKKSDYRSAGWETVELTSTHIRARPGIDVAMLRAALERRGWRP